MEAVTNMTSESVVYLCSFQTIVQYVDAQFEKFLKDESGLNRRNIVDTRVHCCFYFISSAVHGYQPHRLKCRVIYKPLGL